MRMRTDFEVGDIVRFGNGDAFNEEARLAKVVKVNDPVSRTKWKYEIKFLDAKGGGDAVHEFHIHLVEVDDPAHPHHSSNQASGLHTWLSNSK